MYICVCVYVYIYVCVCVYIYIHSASQTGGRTRSILVRTEHLNI